MRRILPALLMLSASASTFAACPDYLQQTLKKLHSTDMVNLCERFGDKPMLIVNTASHCGYTKQFKQLEQIHQQYKAKGLEVVGFPSDDFWQESKDEAETASVCYQNYGVTFSMFTAVHVKGDDANPVFKALAAQSEAPGWNFNKYVVDRHGKLVAHFPAKVKPDAPEVKAAIEKALQTP